MVFREATSGSYTYLGYLCNSCRLLPEQGEQDEHNALHGSYRDSINALTEYPWSHSLMTITGLYSRSASSGSCAYIIQASTTT